MDIQFTFLAFPFEKYSFSKRYTSRSSVHTLPCTKRSPCVCPGRWGWHWGREQSLRAKQLSRQQAELWATQLDQWRRNQMHLIKGQTQSNYIFRQKWIESHNFLKTNWNQLLVIACFLFWFLVQQWDVMSHLKAKSHKSDKQIIIGLCWIPRNIYSLGDCSKRKRLWVILVQMKNSPTETITAAMLNLVQCLVSRIIWDVETH